MGRALPIGIVWWIGKQTEGGLAGGVGNEQKVDMSHQMLWMRFVDDTRYCLLLMWVVSRGMVKSAIGR